MAIKQTHIYRGHAIVHHVFATDQTHEKIERFIVNQPGKGQVCTTSTLAQAKASIDELSSGATGRHRPSPVLVR